MAPNDSTRREFLKGWRPFGGIFGGAGAAFESGGPRARLEDAVRSVGLGPAIDMGAGLREPIAPVTYLPTQGDPESGGATERLRGLARSFTELLHTPMTRRAAIGGMVVGAAAMAGCLGSAPPQKTSPTEADPFAYDPENGLGPSVHWFQIGVDDAKENTVFTLLVLDTTSLKTVEVTIDSKTYKLQPMGRLGYQVTVPGLLSRTSQHTFATNVVDANGYTRTAGQFFGRPKALQFMIRHLVEQGVTKSTLESYLDQGMDLPDLQDIDRQKPGDVRASVRWGTDGSDIFDVPTAADHAYEYHSSPTNSEPGTPPPANYKKFGERVTFDLSGAPRQRPLTLSVAFTVKTVDFSTPTVVETVDEFRYVIPLNLSRPLG